MNVKLIFFSLLLIVGFFCYTQEQSNVSSKIFKLITMLYNEKNPQRINEYIYCFEKNLAHDRIEEIHVFYDTTGDDEENFLLQYLQSKNVGITYINGRATYGDCFKIANEWYPDSYIIISNADIFLNDTLERLNTYDLTNKFLAITRWDVLRDGRIVLFRNRSDSQDAWIFQTPLPLFRNDIIQMGVLDCDGRIAFQARQAGLQVINPCKTIQCCHVHSSGVRNYKDRVGKYPWHEATLVPHIML